MTIKMFHPESAIDYLCDNIRKFNYSEPLRQQHQPDTGSATATPFIIQPFHHHLQIRYSHPLTTALHSTEYYAGTRSALIEST